MRYISSALKLSGLLVIFFGAFASTVSAEDLLGESLIEEVLVTATKRTQNLKDVPITINVLSGDDIAIRGLESGDDIARSIPGMVKTGQGRELDSSFLIRGIGTGSNPGLNLTRPTSVYLDDIPITSNNAGTQPDFRLFDISRVEVLKGPQGTLFGAGTLSGVVRVIANKADPSAFDFSLGTEIGSTGGSLRHRYNAMVNIPFNDKLALRVAGSLRDEDGYMNDVGSNFSTANGDAFDMVTTGTKNSNTIKDDGLRMSLLWDATDKFTATLNYLYQGMETRGYDVFNPETGRTTTGGWLPQGIDSVFKNTNLTLSYDFGFATLTSSTNSYTFDSETVIDITEILVGAPHAFPWGMHRTDEHENFVQEFRLVSNGDSRFKYVVGAFTRESDNTFDHLHFLPPQYVEERRLTGLQPRLDRTWDGYPDGFAYGFINTPVRQSNDKDEAFFAEVSYDITDTVTIALGARTGEVSLEDQVIPQGGREGSQIGGVIGATYAWASDDPRADEYPIAIAQNTASTTRDKSDADTMKISLMWQARDNINLFVLASEGFRGGVANPGFNTNGGVSRVDPTDVRIPAKSKPDSLWNYEVGMKGVFLDGSLSANVSVFYIDWDGFQFFARRRSDASGFTTNVGKAISKGLEAEFIYVPNGNLELGLNFSSINAEIDSISDEEAFMTGGSVGDRLVSPEFSAVAFVQYTAPFNALSGYDWFLRGDIQHVGDMPNAFPNVAGQGVPNSLFQLTDSYENVNFSIGVANENWRVALFGENIFDNDDSTGIDQNKTFEYTHRALVPRTAGLRVTYKAL
jgi:outer membrane receptor protein involved in Fe transport